MHATYSTSSCLWITQQCLSNRLGSLVSRCRNRLPMHIGHLVSLHLIYMHQLNDALGVDGCVVVYAAASQRWDLPVLLQCSSGQPSPKASTAMARDRRVVAFTLLAMREGASHQLTFGGGKHRHAMCARTCSSIHDKTPPFMRTPAAQDTHHAERMRCNPVCTT